MTPSNLEQKYVHNFYATNHTAFSSTRHKPWPSVTEFLNRNKTKLILDAGCGNGRHLSTTSIGIDYTREFLYECVHAANKRALALMACDVSCLPFRDESFDAVLSCAVIHHLENAREGVEQLYRVLRAGGSCMIVVWAVKAVHPHGSRKQNGKFVRIRDSEYLVDWQGKGQMRFYHLYEKDELVELVRSVGFRVVACREEDESINLEAVKD
ncbi:proline 3-hydroxylase, demethylmenaquinone methyltransferase [Trachipleistophora hominis]|uniref:Proline 3-hydroxylase, demethylmenaquinone methyltransferase n=1 Tax=Trachipleistophora hominis TaxID=72359 RepID=L7JTQ9_TRAHO|nr:proline 3-hydroxylase, demethylmenaquinone methyltransferase [Trachipleistophora hominis]